MQLLCPACQTPLEAPAGQVAVACRGCALEVDLSRLGTVAGKPRFLPERDRSGSTVGGYRIEGRLGSGGMGHVYRAVRDTAAGPEPVALKFLAASLAAEPELRARFSREVQLLHGLAHPAIVRVLDSGEVDGVPWFAMTLVPGDSLRARLARGPLDAGEARAVFGRVLAALEHAHGQGVVHRDLKPGNVLLGPEGAVLADFGIARPGQAMAAPMTRLTESAAVLGTLPYMSPEQRAGAALDRRSDLFSVGVMLYEALTGQLPQGAFAPPSKLRAGLPARVDRVVMRLLQPQPADRFATAAEAAGAFASALAPGRGLRVVASTGAVATALALAAGGGWYAFQRSPSIAKIPPAVSNASVVAPGGSQAARPGLTLDPKAAVPTPSNDAPGAAALDPKTASSTPRPVEQTNRLPPSKEDLPLLKNGLAGKQRKIPGRNPKETGLPSKGGLAPKAKPKS
jgi:serine/threonine protein kinase